MNVSLEPTKVAINGINYDIQSASADDLIALKIKIMQAKTATDGQIDQAEERIEAGEEVNQTWLRKAKRASKYHGWRTKRFAWRSAAGLGRSQRSTRQE